MAKNKLSIELKNESYEDLLSEIEDGSVDLVITDPPYEHVMGGMKSKIYNKSGIYTKDSYVSKEMSQFKHDDIFKFLDKVMPKMRKVNMYIFCSKLQLAHYFDYINQHKKLKFDLLIWDKSSKDGKYSMKSSKFFTQDIEYVIRLYESGVSLNKVMDDSNTKANSSYYLKCQKFSKPKGFHESMKPVELLKQYILLSSNEGDLILDPFSGSGSTAKACQETKRNFIGSEINKEIYTKALKRLTETNLLDRLGSK